MNKGRTWCTGKDQSSLETGCFTNESLGTSTSEVVDFTEVISTFPSVPPFTMEPKVSEERSLPVHSEG